MFIFLCPKKRTKKRLCLLPSFPRRRESPCRAYAIRPYTASRRDASL